VGVSVGVAVMVVRHVLRIDRYRLLEIRPDDLDRVGGGV
jgi:hypothetical protein